MFIIICSMPLYSQTIAPKAASRDPCLRLYQRPQCVTNAEPNWSAVLKILTFSKPLQVSQQRVHWLRCVSSIVTICFACL